MYQNTDWLYLAFLYIISVYIRETFCLLYTKVNILYVACQINIVYSIIFAKTRVIDVAFDATENMIWGF